MDLTFPPIFLLPTHIDSQKLHEVEDAVPTLTYNVHEATVVLGNISTAQRAQFELRRLKVHTEPVDTSIQASRHEVIGPLHKKRRLDETSFTEKEQSVPRTCNDHVGTGAAGPPLSRFVKVVKLGWLIDSLEQKKVLDMAAYLLYVGRIISNDTILDSQPLSSSPTSPSHSQLVSKGEDILARAMGDNSGQVHTQPSVLKGTHGYRRHVASTTTRALPPALVHQTTSEHDTIEDLPQVPAFLSTTYSCQRPTPVHSPNAAFIEQLKKIRTARTLIGDRIGVRAYSSSIAAIAAYPYSISKALEVARLPGCGTRIAQLYHEWTTTGKLDEVEVTRSDPKLSVVHLFYNIWGVGDITAREFYKRGWRDLDDIVEFGWDSLSRVQQIGVKYYEEFLKTIPRDEVESIGNIILQHARAINPNIQLLIVGGYRRGKRESGDVDVVVSHPDERVTHNLVHKIVMSLEKSKHVTHTLTLSLRNSERGQVPVAWKGNTSSGSGFDTLDKALVVWRKPETLPTAPCSQELGHLEDDDSELANSSRPHRRVDIIVSPWKTVGCAVLGWSGGTTFQRDVRRYCKNLKGLKFDSSGIRSRADGSWVDLESSELGLAPDMVTAEKRVFSGLGLDWREPEERSTG